MSSGMVRVGRSAQARGDGVVHDDLEAASAHLADSLKVGVQTIRHDALHRRASAGGLFEDMRAAINFPEAQQHACSGGHGVFEQTGLGARPGALTGQGSLVLMNAAGGPAPMAADQLAVNLRGRGVQVVVLGACETGKRDAAGHLRSKTSHTLNAVPCYLYVPGHETLRLDESIAHPAITNISATTFQLLGYERPEGYDSSLLE